MTSCRLWSSGRAAAFELAFVSSHLTLPTPTYAACFEGHFIPKSFNHIDNVLPTQLKNGRPINLLKCARNGTQKRLNPPPIFVSLLYSGCHVFSSPCRGCLCCCCCLCHQHYNQRKKNSIHCHSNIGNIIKIIK